jgi:putative transcriptional regulator
MSTVRLRIDDLLKERGRSAYWLANEIGMTHGGFYKILHGKFKALNMDVLGRICDALQCQPGDLLVLVEDRPQGKRKPKEKTPGQAERSGHA